MTGIIIGVEIIPPPLGVDTVLVHIIGNVADYLPNYQITTVFTSENNAKNERNLTKNFLTGFSEGIDDYASTMIDKKNGDAGINEMVDLIHKYVYTSRPRAKAAPSIINGTMRLSAGASLNLRSVKDQLDWFKSEGLVKKSITIDTLVDQSYVKIIS